MVLRKEKDCSKQERRSQDTRTARVGGVGPGAAVILLGAADN